MPEFVAFSPLDTCPKAAAQTFLQALPRKHQPPSVAFIICSPARVACHYWRPWVQIRGLANQRRPSHTNRSPASYRCKGEITIDCDAVRLCTTSRETFGQVDLIAVL